MNIRLALEKDIPVLLGLFRDAYGALSHVPETEQDDFEECLRAAFDEKQVYKIYFFLIEKDDDEIISFASIAPCSFMNGSWELRWGTTHPDFQKQGLMTKLTEHRINYAINKNQGVPGILQIASREPNLYKKLGFKTVFERNIENYVMYLIKEI